MSTGVLDIGHTILVNSAYLSPPYQVSAIGPADLLRATRPVGGLARLHRDRRGAFGLDIQFAEPATVDVPAFAGSLNLREPGRSRRRARCPVTQSPPRSPVHRRSQLLVAAVAFLLGLLVVVQVRPRLAATGSRAVGPGPDGPGREPQHRQRPAPRRDRGLDQQLETLARAGRDARRDLGRRIRTDLERIRVWAGLDPVAGDGITITVRGPIGAPDVEDVINELRNAGAEAIAIDDVRVVTGTVIGGLPGSLSVDDTPLATRSRSGRSARRSR